MNQILLEPPNIQDLLPDPFWQEAWFIATIAAIVLVIGWLVFRHRRQSPAADSAAARRTAFHQARKQLNAAAEAEMPAREAAVVISLALREYLTVAGSDPALFETQEEFSARPRAIAVLPEDLRERCVAEFAKLARLKYTSDPPAVDSTALFDDAIALLEALHAVLAMPAASTAVAASSVSVPPPLPPSPRAS